MNQMKTNVVLIGSLFNTANLVFRQNAIKFVGFTLGANDFHQKDKDILP